MELQGGLGQIDQGAVEAQIRRRLPEINRCYTEVLSRLWYLAGRLELKLRVAADGQVRSAAVTRSTVGNYEVERCVAQVVHGVAFPRPQGGEAEFTYPVEFAARAPVGSWPPDRLEPAMARYLRQAQGCPGAVKAPPALRVTLYIGPGGRVASAGLSADDPIDDRLGACLVARALTWRFPDPLGQLVKASYAFN
jgi:TonB family protein